MCSSGSFKPRYERARYRRATLSFPLLPPPPAANANTYFLRELELLHSGKPWMADWKHWNYAAAIRATKVRLGARARACFCFRPPYLSSPYHTWLHPAMLGFALPYLTSPYYAWLRPAMLVLASLPCSIPCVPGLERRNALRVDGGWSRSLPTTTMSFLPSPISFLPSSPPGPLTAIFICLLLQFSPPTPNALFPLLPLSLLAPPPTFPHPYSPPDINIFRHCPQH